MVEGYPMPTYPIRGWNGAAVLYLQGFAITHENRTTKYRNMRWDFQKSKISLYHYTENKRTYHEARLFI